ncbi:amidohydrolase family protein [Methylobacterium sp. C33D]
MKTGLVGFGNREACRCVACEGRRKQSARDRRHAVAHLVHVADSDAPLSPIRVGVTRELVGRPDGPVLSPAEESLTVAEAIRANAMGAAYRLRMDDRSGSAAAGRRADLIVLGRSSPTIDPRVIHRTEVALTKMDGSVRHRARGSDRPIRRSTVRRRPARPEPRAGPPPSGRTPRPPAASSAPPS